MISGCNFQIKSAHAPQDPNCIFQSKLARYGLQLSADVAAARQNKSIIEWFDAVRRDDVPAMRKIIANDEIIAQDLATRSYRVSVNAQDRNGCTALMWAVFFGYESTVKYLLSFRDIDVNIQNNKGFSALIIAADCSHENIVYLLLQISNIKVNAQDNEGRTSLMRAAEMGNENIVLQLLRAPHININVQDQKGQTALFLAYTFYRRENIVKLLLEAPGVDVNTASDDTLFIWAVCRGDETMINRLLKVPGFDVNAPNKSGWTGLMKSIKEHITRLLLQIPGINVNAQNYTGNTALHIAVHWNYEDIVKLLLQYGADVNAQSKDGSTPLMGAVNFGHQSLVNALLDVPGIKINTLDCRGRTACAYAKERKYVAIEELINNKLMALAGRAFEAIHVRDVESLRRIVAQTGVDTIANESGNTLLDKAFSVNSPQMIEFLMQAADDPREQLARFPFDAVSPSTLVFEFITKLAYGEKPASSESSIEYRPCRKCAKATTLFCGRCRKAYYCCAKCQKDDWPAHKLSCPKSQTQVG